MRLLQLTLILLLTLAFACNKNDDPIIEDPIQEPDYLLPRSGLLETNPHGSVNEIECDDQNNVWICTNGNGVVKYSGLDYQTYTNLNSGLASNKVNCIVSHANKLYFGTGDNGLSIFDGANWEHYNRYNSELPKDEIFDMAMDQSGTLWLVSYDNLTSFDGTEFISTRIDLEIGLSHPAVIKVDKNNEIWLGGNQGFFKYSNQTFNDFDQPIGSLFDFDFDSNENIWLASPAYGLQMFNGDTTYRYTPPDSINLDLTIFTVAIDSEDNIWCGSSNSSYSGALIKFVPSSEQWSYLKSPSNVAEQAYNVTSMAADKYDNIWASSLRGLCIYKEDGVTYN